MHPLLHPRPHLLPALLTSLLCALGPARAAAPAHPPLALHPDNPRYFLFRGAPTIIIGSGEHYGAVLNLDFDFEPYLDALRACGLNHTRTFSGVYREVPGSFGITDNPLAPVPGRYICPWPRSETPGASDGGAKFDLAKWDEAYFQRLRAFLAKAAECGVIVELNLFCPFYEDVLWQASPMNAANNVNGIGACPRTEVYTLKHKDLLDAHEAVTRRIVRELNQFDSLYYEVCNEPYFGGVTQEWQDHIASVIADEESCLPARHLISMNIANGAAKVTNPHPAVSIFNFHYCVPPDAVAMNAHLNKPIGENETGFRGSADVTYRTEGWAFILAGGALYSNLDYSFTPAHPRGDLAGYTSPGGGSPALRRQLSILREFIHGFDFTRMAPAASLVQGALPEGLQARALAEPGRAYALYLYASKPGERDFSAGASLQLALAPGIYLAEWLDPVSGRAVKSEKLTATDAGATLASPGFKDDLALRLVRQ